NIAPKTAARPHKSQAQNIKEHALARACIYCIECPLDNMRVALCSDDPQRFRETAILLLTNSV
ncbi:MAG TPA: hypothetical protein VIJ25_04735, partial [Methylococcales bacterium]